MKIVKCLEKSRLLIKIISETIGNEAKVQKGGFLSTLLGAYVKNLIQYKSTETHCIALYVVGDNVTYFDNLGVEHVPKEIKNLKGNKNIATNISNIQAKKSIMCG